jgi:glycosyltransferase involved in cell wall biosynthesis
MMTPLISIIIPTYNSAELIGAAIDSVLAQTYQNWECIIVDDGSTDNTLKLCNQYIKLDSRVKYLYQENGKQGKARNLGISKANGFYLAFLDADDLWLPEKLSVQIVQIQKHDVDLVFSDSYVFNDNALNNLSQKMNVLDAILYDKNSMQLFLEINKVPILTVLVKREKVLSVGGFSENLDIQNVEDYHLWLKLLMTNCMFYSSSRILAKYRIHNTAATSSDKLSLDKIPVAFFDLIQLYPRYKGQIEFELKLKFKRIYKTKLFTKSELGVWIKKNTTYLSKSKVTQFYLFLNFLFPAKVTKRILMLILND